jgi:hypothetical protein
MSGEWERLRKVAEIGAGIERAEQQAAALLSQVAAVGVGVHRTETGWPMVALHVGGLENAVEPVQAREIANALQTLAEKIIRRAAAVDGMRTRGETL